MLKIIVCVFFAFIAMLSLMMLGDAVFHHNTVGALGWLFACVVFTISTVISGKDMW